MAVTSLSIKIDKSLKKEAQKVLEELGLTISSAVKGYLKEVVRTKKVEFQLEENLELSDWAIEQLRLSDEDIKAGRVISFESPEEEIEYLERMIARNEKKATKN